MKKTTKKLAGRQLERFLVRFLSADDGVDRAAAERLARKGAAAFTSLRVRRIAFDLLRDRRAAPLVTTVGTASPTIAGAPKAASAEAVPDAAASAKFDPYVFGLVPVFQREGRDGLLARLRTITTIEHLRLMAKSQQIALEAGLRAGDVPPEDLRAAIATAVEKRIADRRAAAS